MSAFNVTHSTWSDTGKTMCGRSVAADAIDEWAPTCKTCCKALEYHFGETDG